MINKDELLDVVDENNNLIEPKPRHVVHSQGLWHRVSHIWIYNFQKQLLCQKRSLLKDSAPGKMEPFFGGHLQVGIEYLDGAKRELNEELGLEFKENDLKLWKIFKNERGKEYQGVFVCHWEGNPNDLVFEKEEIDQVKWVFVDEVGKVVLRDKNTDWSYMGYEEELLPYILGL
jgi:isopentenyl-diphosphate Delta-isomerase